LEGGLPKRIHQIYSQLFEHQSVQRPMEKKLLLRDNILILLPPGMGEGLQVGIFGAPSSAAGGMFCRRSNSGGSQGFSWSRGALVDTTTFFSCTDFHEFSANSLLLEGRPRGQEQATATPLSHLTARLHWGTRFQDRIGPISVFLHKFRDTLHRALGRLSGGAGGCHVRIRPIVADSKLTFRSTALIYAQCAIGGGVFGCESTVLSHGLLNSQPTFAPSPSQPF